MRWLSVVPRGRKAVVALVLVFVVTAAVAALVPAPAEAQTRCGTEFQYYSDASLTELVGIRGWLPYESCGCQFYTWGVITVHKVVLDSYC